MPIDASPARHETPTPAETAAVLERIAADQFSDPASDDLTVPLAIQLAETEARLHRLEALNGDLLEALEYALPYLRAAVPSPRDNGLDINCIARAERAIAKATGGQ